MGESIAASLRRQSGSGRKVRVTRGMPARPTLTGFILATSPTLAIMRTFDDFEPDGFAIFRIADVESLRSGPHERFWDAMLKSEGLLGDVKAPPPVDVSSIEAAIESVAETSRYMILHVEDEKDPIEDFYIGERRAVEPGLITFRNFNALGRWERKLHRIQSGEITLIEFETPYIRRYISYMTKLGRIAQPKPRRPR